MIEQRRDDAVSIWSSAVEAVDPAALVKNSLYRDGDRLVAASRAFDLGKAERVAVVGGGKAGRSMAEAVESVLGKATMKAKRLEGWVNVLNEAAGELHRIVLHGSRPEGSPLPTANGVRGAKKMVELLRSLGPTDLAVCLISGGGSAMMPAPVPGVTLRAKRDVTRQLSERGATIGELNVVRKHLSTVKGGQLARACRAGALVSLIMSDVVGDRLDSVASGPTVPDGSTYADALSVLNKTEVSELAPVEVMEHIARGVRGEIEDTPSALPDSVANVMIGNNETALGRAERAARALGYTVLNLGSYMEGEASEAGGLLVSLARSIKSEGKPVSPPACVLWGGETTVSDVAPRGKGGRNQELVLAAIARCFDGGMDGALIFSASTDGEDGPTDAAGGFADQRSLDSCRALGLRPERFLERNDSYRLLEQAAAQFKSGPTGTNVMDITMILVT